VPEPVEETKPVAEEKPVVEEKPIPEVKPVPAEAPVIKKPQTEAEVKQVQQEVKELKNVVVQETAKEIKISMGDIGFKGNSNELLETEYQKLDKICELLSTYGGKLLITGHCARFGDTSNDVKFSTERAQTVADYIIARGIYKAEDVSVEGKGSSVPVATNDTEEGRAKNRRVEITVLKK
jgi:outer membrane protein OmpA-like peptidoglycan-associated protein